MKNQKFDRKGALSAGTFIVVIISLGIGLAFFTVIPDFVSTAVGALIDASDPVNNTAINNITATILNLVPFIVGALFIAYPLAFLALELRRVD